MSSAELPLLFVLPCTSFQVVTERCLDSGVNTGMALRTEREKIAHLLRRFGFGASEAELGYYSKDGLSGAIDMLLDTELVEEDVVPIEAFTNKQNGNLNIKGAQTWWALRILSTRRPLQEKMVLFWHHHFATSAQKVDVATAMVGQNEVFRQFGLGKFETLLSQVSKDPAMIYWLDNIFNVKGKPNENFAREVMELFTLGIGHYTEKDIQEAARAFTGWSYGVGGRKALPRTDRMVRRAQFVFREELHDEGMKRLLGKDGAFSGEEVLGLLCAHSQTALFLTQKLWEYFAYAKPERALVERLAEGFKHSALDIKVLLRSIMQSPEFYSSKAERTRYKNPVDFCASTVRQLGIGPSLVQRYKAAQESGNEKTKDIRGLVGLLPMGAFNVATKGMGMELFFPPDVSGWREGEDWITSATMVERIKWADRLFGKPVGRSPAMNYPAMNLFGESSSPESVVRKLLSVFDAQLPAAKVSQMIQAAGDVSRAEITPKNANLVAIRVSRLIFGSPEFQFS